jgi:hypothetical protein
MLLFCQNGENYQREGEKLDEDENLKKSGKKMEVLLGQNVKLTKRRCAKRFFTTGFYITSNRKHIWN